MAGQPLNTFLAALRSTIAEQPLAEKWLLAPSLRVGFQWLDAVTRSGQPVLNVRVRTLRHLALDLAAAEMSGAGLTFLRGRRVEVVMARVLGHLQQAAGGYLSALAVSPGLVRALSAALRDLRLAGLHARDLRGRAFEVQAKAREIKRLLTEYERLLRREELADYADVLRLAADRLRADAGALPEDALLIMPDDEEEGLGALERAVWLAVPEARRRALPVDRPGDPPQGKPTDLDLLRWLASPVDAPGPVNDGTARIFRSVGEVNEVREVLRRCIEDGIAFDEVEILHTDSRTYVPLLFELAARLAPEGDDALPVTFAEGLPARFSRPGRALLGWLSWIREGFPQATLVRMVQDGLLCVSAGTSSFASLAAVLRTIAIGAGRQRHMEAIDRARAALERQAKQAMPEEQEPEDDEHAVHDLDVLGPRIEGLERLRDLVAGLLPGLPPGHAGAKAILDSAADFLRTHARCVSRMDAYSREKLLDEIKEMAQSLDQDGDALSLDPWTWLAQLPLEARVGGQGPRPGCLHVAPLLSGGHSARTHTFIVGLDDARFPGAGLQDPLILDRERGRLSNDLPTAAGRLASKVEGFGRLLARLRGFVTLSYCCRDLVDDRDMFPTGPLLAAYRVLSGDREGDQDAMTRWVGAPASFAPVGDKRCLDSGEWWLWRLCSGRRVRDPLKAVGDGFPHLGRGLKAQAARASNRFTEYDGYVPEAGQDGDPARPDGPVMSASRLETLGTCPMEYFFKYVLGVEPPEEIEIDPNVWLDPMQRGSLLHDVFCEFMTRLREAGRLPELRRDAKLMDEILDRSIRAAAKEIQAPNREVFDRQTRELRQTARVFLQEEEVFCKSSRPLCFEASIGMPPHGKGTLLDSRDPVSVPLPGGKAIRARGRIDRVDEDPESSGRRFTLWDYKTGSAYGYDRSDPFRAGRRVQAWLYLALAEARLKKEVGPEAKVTSFGYFFPRIDMHGERRQWSADKLAHGAQVIERLCEMVARGCFPFTDSPDDVTYSDYAAAFGDTQAAAEAVARKLVNLRNEALAPFRELRGFEGEGGLA